jgi:hypothetical protein
VSIPPAEGDDAAVAAAGVSRGTVADHVALARLDAVLARLRTVDDLEPVSACPPLRARLAVLTRLASKASGQQGVASSPKAPTISSISAAWAHGIAGVHLALSEALANGGDSLAARAAAETAHEIALRHAPQIDPAYAASNDSKNNSDNDADDHHHHHHNNSSSSSSSSKNSKTSSSNGGATIAVGFAAIAMRAACCHARAIAVSGQGTLDEALAWIQRGREELYAAVEALGVLSGNNHFLCCFVLLF